MKERTYISLKCMPPKAPVHTAIIWWLLLDRLSAPAWAYWILVAVVATLAVGFVSDLRTGKAKIVPGFGERG